MFRSDIDRQAAERREREAAHHAQWREKLRALDDQYAHVTIRRVLVYSGPAWWIAKTMANSQLQGAGTRHPQILQPGCAIECVEETIEIGK